MNFWIKNNSLINRSIKLNLSFSWFNNLINFFEIDIIFHEFGELRSDGGSTQLLTIIPVVIEPESEIIDFNTSCIFELLGILWGWGVEINTMSAVGTVDNHGDHSTLWLLKSCPSPGVFDSISENEVETLELETTPINIGVFDIRPDGFLLSNGWKIEWFSTQFLVHRDINPSSSHWLGGIFGSCLKPSELGTVLIGPGSGSSIIRG